MLRPTPLTEGTWDIYWIVVDNAFRGTGIGRALLRHAEQEIQNAGGRMILIETSSKDEYAVRTGFTGKWDMSRSVSSPISTRRATER